MAEMTDAETWLERNTFECSNLRARISPGQCARNRENSHMMNFAACKTCTDWKGVEVGLSGNVIRETADAIEKAESLEQAAKMLKITEAGLQYRLRNYLHLTTLAQARGWYTPRKRQDDILDKPTGGMVEIKAGAQIEKGDAVALHEGAAWPFTEPSEPQETPSGVTITISISIPATAIKAFLEKVRIQ